MQIIIFFIYRISLFIIYLVLPNRTIIIAYLKLVY